MAGGEGALKTVMAPISTLDLSRLPAPPELERLMQSLAMLEVLIEPDWDFRFYSFYAGWSDGAGMGWRRDRSRLELFALFADEGCFIKGYDPEAAVADVDPGLFYRQVPAEFADVAGEVAFTPEDVTFCLWRGPSDCAWQRAAVPAYAGGRDGSEALLSPLDGDPASYPRFVEARFGGAADAATVAAVYAHRPLTPELAYALGGMADWDDLVREAREIGYPVG
ncbi:MAG TPA: hypothetical protein VF688_12830 [Allosphingosinicella sp.]|jgi:hypothetical protein